MEDYNYERCEAHTQAIDRIYDELKTLNKRLLVGNGQRSIVTQLELNTQYIEDDKEEKKATRRMIKGSLIGQATNIGLIISLILIVVKLFNEIGKMQ